MNEVDVKDEGAFFDRFLADSPEKGRFSDVFTISSLLYVAFTQVDLAANGMHQQPNGRKFLIVMRCS